MLSLIDTPNSSLLANAAQTLKPSGMLTLDVVSFITGTPVFRRFQKFETLKKSQKMERRDANILTEVLTFINYRRPGAPVAERGWDPSIPPLPGIPVPTR